MFEGIELFASLSEPEKQKLSLFCQSRFIKAGETLFVQGEESNSMYIVKTGLLQATTPDNVLGQIGPSELVGEMAIFAEPQYRSATVTALHDTELIVILTYSLQKLIETHPDIIQKIRQIIEIRKRHNAWI